MKNINTQKEITLKVVEYKYATGWKKDDLYSELFNMLAPKLEARAKNFLKAIGKNTLLVDENQYISVALYEGFHKSLESFDINKNNNFIPYLYFCTDNALKTQVGKDNSDVRKINEQVVTYTGLVSMLGGHDLSDLDSLDVFVANDTIDELLSSIEEPEMVSEFRKVGGDLKADVILCYTLRKDLQQDAVCRVYGVTDYSTVKTKACRARQEFKKFLLSRNN